MEINEELNKFLHETKYNLINFSIYSHYQEVEFEIELINKDTYDIVKLIIKNPKDIEDLKSKIEKIIKLSPNVAETKV